MYISDILDIPHIPARLDVKPKGVVTHFYVTYGIKCSLCHKQGHKRANCPRKTGVLEDKLVLPVEAPAAHTQGWTKPPSTSNTMPVAAPTQADHRPQQTSLTAAVETAPPPSRASNAPQEDPTFKSIPTTSAQKNLEPKTSRKRRQGPASRPSSSKPMPSNNSALSTPAAELSAPIKKTPSTPSSPAAPSPGANFPVRPFETPAPELPAPAPSTSQLPSRPEPFSTNTEPSAAPEEENQDMTDQVENIFIELNADSILAPLYDEVDDDEVVIAVIHRSDREALPDALSYENRKILYEFLGDAIENVGDIEHLT
ncbi:hypothetical protein LAZ67_19001734 [Cordylochernes scorpioides]|uniref:CCHC-type domain-containing protein n=1 Tax=Cordylochernes scorpioides TaxID=51811 RepID=A0ABY6LHY4_9ARAC|nr:hypothetical protein LAZ67_19001734 [Cordylochernes scorpioides]